VSGSLVRGDGGPASDLDVVVVHDRAWRLREQRRFRGVPAELVREARDWLAKPLAPSDADLASLRYMVVDALDDARDVADPALQQLLLAQAVNDTLAYVLWRHRRFQPRRKELLAAVGALEPATAELAARWAAQPTLAAAEELARHVLGVDTFFEWTSAKDPVMLDP
jgi:nucleotidyltransferase-like protein